MSEDLAAETQEAAPAATEETTEVIETSEQAVTEESTEKVTEQVETKSPIDERIGELMAKWRGTERERDALKQQLDVIEQERTNEILNRAPPTEEQFDFDTTAHAAALQQHYIAQGQAQGQAHALQQVKIREAQVAQARDTAAYNTRVQEFAVKAPDFVQSVSMLQVSPDVQQMLMRDEQGPQMAYLASKNPVIAAKLQSLDPAVRTQGIVDIKLEIAGSPKANKISSAGEPNESQLQGGIKPEVDEFSKRFPNAEII